MEISGDVYVMYYEPGAQSIDTLKNMFDRVKEAVSPKPVIALPNGVSLTGMSKKEFLNVVAQILDGDVNDLAKLSSAPSEEDTAEWKTWGGWCGNHDQRIEGTTCTKCGYEHPTVYGSLKRLSPYCPRCGRKMIGVIEY